MGGLETPADMTRPCKTIVESESGCLRAEPAGGPFWPRRLWGDIFEKRPPPGLLTCIVDAERQKCNHAPSKCIAFGLLHPQENSASLRLLSGMFPEHRRGLENGDQNIPRLREALH